MARELVIYNARRNPTPAPLFRLYGQLSGTDVTIVDGPYGPTASRIRAERDAPAGDVVVTKSRPDMDALREEGLLTPDLDAGGVELPAWLRAEDGSWFGFSAWPRLAIVNRAVLPDADTWPRSLEDFTLPQWRGQFAVASILERTTRAHFAALIAVRGRAYVEGLLDRLVANGMRVFPGNTGLRIAMMREPFAGAWASASNVHVFYYGGNAVGAAWLDQEADAPGTHVEAHSVGVLRGCPHADAAREFVSFLLAPEAQTFLAKLYGETPVNARADHGDVRPLAQIRRLDAPLAEMARLMPDTLDLLRAKGLTEPDDGLDGAE